MIVQKTNMSNFNKLVGIGQLAFVGTGEVAAEFLELRFVHGRR